MWISFSKCCNANILCLCLSDRCHLRCVYVGAYWDRRPTILGRKLIILSLFEHIGAYYTKFEHIGAYYSKLEYIGAYYSKLENIIPNLSILEHIIPNLSILEHIIANLSILEYIIANWSILEHIIANLSILEHIGAYWDRRLTILGRKPMISILRKHFFGQSHPASTSLSVPRNVNRFEFTTNFLTFGRALSSAGGAPIRLPLRCINDP